VEAPRRSERLAGHFHPFESLRHGPLDRNPLASRTILETPQLPDRPRFYESLWMTVVESRARRRFWIC
jgi:hypothetical protein